MHSRAEILRGFDPARDKFQFCVLSVAQLINCLLLLAILLLSPSSTMAQSLNWSYQTGGLVYSSPAVSSDGTTYIGSADSYLYALNSDSTLKWKFQTGDSVDSSATIDTDGTIYVGSYDNYLYALNPDGRFSTLD